MNWRPAHRFPALCMAVLLCSAAHAHESYMDCSAHGDGTVTCEAGYEDGSPPGERDRILIKDASGKNLLEGHFDEAGTYTFTRPEGDFMMVFIGSAVGHSLRIKSSKLIAPQ
jgi:hypothetical protein